MTSLEVILVIVVISLWVVVDRVATEVHRINLELIERDNKEGWNAGVNTGQGNNAGVSYGFGEGGADKGTVVLSSAPPRPSAANPEGLPTQAD